jgi:cell division protein FtsB
MRNKRQIIVLLLCAMLSAYFGYHAIHGRHGLEARATLVVRAAELELRLEGLETVRARLERNVALLSDQSLNADMLDETARSVLGFAGERDIVVMTR